MIPEPKYLTNLDKHSASVRRNDRKNSNTHAKTDFGMCIQDDRFAMTGNMAPKSEQKRMMKTEAIRNPRKRSSPPPSLQSTSPSSRGRRTWGRFPRTDIVAREGDGPGTPNWSISMCDDCEGTRFELRVPSGEPSRAESNPLADHHQCALVSPFMLIMNDRTITEIKNCMVGLYSHMFWTSRPAREKYDPQGGL